jgi:tRNA pseudouridine55 synthase
MKMLSGILLIDKPAGVTSFDVVRRARRALQMRKIGHLGTLDPFATGLLPLCLGEATKLVPYLQPRPKTYRATLRLGVATDTQDWTGQVIAQSDHLPDPAAVKAAAERFVGEISQVPPMYSALHYQGERLYKIARRGEVVELPPRKVTVHELVVEEIALPLVTILVRCSQGTYVRTLAADLGAALGCGAHLTSLRRTAVGSFRVEDALPLAALAEGAGLDLRAQVIPLRECLPGWRRVTVGPLEARKLRLGQPFVWAGGELVPGEQVAAGTEAELVAVARVEYGSFGTVLAPERVFVNEQ